MKRLLSFVQFVGFAAFAVAEAVQLLLHGTDGFAEATLLNGLTYLIGVNGIVAGSGHLFFPDPVADSIGWTRGSPFQWEVGLADVGYGVLGVMCSSYGPQFWLATIIVSSVFLLGAAVGHVRQIMMSGNSRSGNAGAILYTDVAIPVFMAVMYVVVV